MTRRSLLAMIAGFPIGLPFVKRSTPVQDVLGPMTVERERYLASRGIKVTVFVDDVDVTRRCRFADDTPGRQCAELFKHRDGKPYFDHEVGAVATEVFTSGVRMTLERRAVTT